MERLSTVSTGFIRENAVSDESGTKRGVNIISFLGSSKQENRKRLRGHTNRISKRSLYIRGREGNNAPSEESVHENVDQIPLPLLNEFEGEGNFPDVEDIQKAFHQEVGQKPVVHQDPCEEDWDGTSRSSNKNLTGFDHRGSAGAPKDEKKSEVG